MLGKLDNIVFGRVQDKTKQKIPYIINYENINLVVVVL